MSDATNKLNIVIEGCCHGELDMIYASIAQTEQRTGTKVDLLLCCGDFQSLRDETDFAGLQTPNKFKKLGSFPDYYYGRKHAPVLTIFIGGNHEASSYLQELHYGGWVAPNIYFLGFSGVVSYGGIRIGGLSGIYKQRNYFKGRYEVPPYDQDSIRSVYHYRELEVFKLAQLTGHIDIMMSHDWPRGIHRFGDAEKLLKVKPFFREEVENNLLGSPPVEKLLQALKPTYWFSAHLHVKFAAVVPTTERQTKFLALDKCLPHRDFLQLISLCRPSDIPDGLGDPVLRYDPEWLAIVKATHHLVSRSHQQVKLPSQFSRVSPSDVVWIKERFSCIPQNFSLPSTLNKNYKGLAGNPQTDQFLASLELEHIVTIPCEDSLQEGNAQFCLEDTTVESVNTLAKFLHGASNDVEPQALDPNEILLDDDTD